jgi:dATP pyrophosphohydrolase
LVYAARRRGDRWEYLLLRRAQRGEAFWQGVSGGLEGEETPAAAARRELREETGFAPARVEDLHYGYTFPLADRWRDLYAPGVTELREQVFVADVTGQPEPVIDPGEHDAWRWCGLAEALRLLRWPDNREALRRAHRRLRSPAP